jgi:urease accessory protein
LARSHRATFSTRARKNHPPAQLHAGQPLLGILVWFGGIINAEIVAQIRSLAPQTEIGWRVASVAGGLICRYRGSDRPAVQKWFIAVWDLLRRQYRDRSACLPRVWQR